LWKKVLESKYGIGEVLLGNESLFDYSWWKDLRNV